ncbi:MAG TPA: sigma factor [Polyangiaceae bacterium]|nr:sigma factor [Polyangiaceae bacterium]
MAAPVLSHQNPHATLLADPALREGLLKYARRRLPPAEVEDLVQNTLTEALIAANAPSDPADFRRWVRGIARHKIADSHRRRGRLPLLAADVDQNAAEPRASAPSTSELSQWIESELPKTEHARATLHWLLREGDGETLDEIARDVDLPAPRVRQRVSRLRRHFHARWLALGAAGLVCLLGLGALMQRALSPAVVVPNIAPEPGLPLEQARLLRQSGLQHCVAGAYPECIAALDRAKSLDPEGENASAIREARAAAARAEQPLMKPASSAEAPASSLPAVESTPKRRAPSKLLPKPIAPSKSIHKPEPLGAPPQQKAMPSKSSSQQLFVDPASSNSSVQQPRSKKFSAEIQQEVDKR